MKDVAALHQAEFDTPPDVVVTVPASVRILGEHTEESEGLVLSASFDMRLAVAVSFRRDAALRFHALDLGERKRTTLANLKFKREDRWANFPKGVCATLAERGLATKGFNFTVSSDIPQGIGLGSSAALSVASAAAFDALYGLALGETGIAELAREAETVFMGRQVPASEHLIPALSRPGSLLALDARSGARRLVPYAFEDAGLVLTDSRVPRPVIDAEMEQRADDCRKCLAALGSRRGGKTLRDFGLDDLEELMGVLQESVRRRCLHIMEEMQRVSEAEDALARVDLPSFSRLVNKSQAGLRNLFEISCPEVDWLAKRALEIDGVHWSRLTGRGFGGCTLTAMRSSAVDEYRARLEEYERIFGFRAVAWEAALDGGISLS